MKRLLIAGLLACGLLSTTTVASAHEPEHEASVVAEPESYPADTTAILSLSDAVPKLDQMVDVVEYINDGQGAIVRVKNKGQLERLQHLPGVSQVQFSKMGKTSFSLPGKAFMPSYDKNETQTYTGSGTITALIDVGFDPEDGSIDQNVLAKQCVLDTNECPNGTGRQSGGTAADDDFCLSDSAHQIECYHGTAMAQLVAGQHSSQDYTGIAPDSKLVLIRAGRYDTTGALGMTDAAVLSSLSWLRDQIDAHAWDSTGKVTAVNLSWSSASFSHEDGLCNTSTYQQWLNIFAALNGRGVSVTVASGNDGNTNAISFPACTPAAVSVGGTDLDGLGNQIIWSSTDLNAYTDALAPATQNLLIHGNAFSASGTSNSSAVIAGMLAVLGSENSAVANRPLREGALRWGEMVSDNRSGCPCWESVATDFKAAKNSYWDLLATADKVVVTDPVRVFDSRFGYGDYTGKSQTDPQVKALDTLGLATRVGGWVGLTAGAVKGVILNVSVYSATVNSAGAMLYVGRNAISSNGPTAIGYLYTGMDPTNYSLITAQGGGYVGVDIGQQVVGSGNAACPPSPTVCAVHVAVDMVGWIGINSDVNLPSGLEYRPYDGRTSTAIAAGSSTPAIQVTSSTGYVPTGATAIVGVIHQFADANNTAAGVTSTGRTSVVSPASHVGSNMGVWPLDSNGQLQIKNMGSAGSSTFILDVYGYLTSSSADLVVPSTTSQVYSQSAGPDTTLTHTGGYSNCASSLSSALVEEYLLGSTGTALTHHSGTSSAPNKTLAQARDLASNSWGTMTSTAVRESTTTRVRSGEATFVQTAVACIPL